MMNDLAQRLPIFRRLPIGTNPIGPTGAPIAATPFVDTAPIIQRINGVDVLGNTPTSAITNTLAAIEADGGTGANLPAPADLPSVSHIFGATEQQVMDAASVANAGKWESATSALGPNIEMLRALGQSGSSGGVNLQLGPQLDFAPADSTTTTTGGSGAGMGVFLLLALGIVGGLVWYHFKHKKASSGAQTA